METKQIDTQEIFNQYLKDVSLNMQIQIPRNMDIEHRLKTFLKKSLVR